MGDIIQFPRIKKEPEDEKTAQLRRIQESLRKINELMEKLRDAQDRSRGNFD